MAVTVINERAQLLLKVLVERYIRDGQPVGSKNLLQESGLSLSPATIRNVMADLEERGLLVSPHTSAGRVPTAQAFRLFVDSLITVQPMGEEYLRGLQRELNPDKSPAELATAASRLLSNLSAQAGLVTVPRADRVSLRQVEFLPLSDNRVLAILVVNEKDVQNRIIHTHQTYSEAQLKQASNMINQRFAGRGLDAIREGLLDAMRDDRQSIDHHMQAMLDLASRTFEHESAAEETPYVLAGESRLLDATPPQDMDKLRELLNGFENKKSMLDLVDRCIRADGVQIFIGAEAGFELLGDFSLVTASYQVAGNKLGVLGVIGPTRMAYERVIPLVDVTARLLSIALGKP